MTGTIFDIQKFCVHDGPGIRTTVFFKGCPLRCPWCHNPESRSRERELLFYPEKCTGCGSCRELSIERGELVCPQGARILCGRRVTTDEVMAEVRRDFDFYAAGGGGVTLSGGEPLFQPAFARAILKACREAGIHTAVETCGITDSEALASVAEYTDLFLFDIKETDAARYKAYTGADHATVMRSLSFFNTLGKAIVLRCPIIPGYNDREAHYEEICHIANTTESVLRIELLPYHALGEGKYTALGIDGPKIMPPREEEVERILAYLSARTEKEVRRA